jgi:hypothetical protein
MKHQRLLDPSSFPRDGFPYTDPDTGYVSMGKTLEALIAAASLHRQANGLTVPADFALLVETQICRVFLGRCVNRDGSDPDNTCLHRGDVIRMEGCATCGGVQAKIRACALFGECTEFTKNMGVRMCGLCPDRVSTLTPDEQ